MSNNCQITIENLSQADSCANNMSGVNTIFFIRKNDVSEINATSAASPSTYADRVTIGSSAMETKAFSCPSGKGFAKMYCAEDLGELKYNMQGPVGSRSLKAELEVFHPAFKKKILGFLGSHINEELLVVAVLNNGENHLLGNMRRGCKIADSTEATSGKSVSDDANGATIHFTWNTPTPQIFFDGWDPEDDTNGLPLVSE